MTRSVMILQRLVMGRAGSCQRNARFHCEPGRVIPDQRKFAARARHIIEILHKSCFFEEINQNFGINLSKLSKVYWCVELWPTKKANQNLKVGRKKFFWSWMSKTSEISRFFTVQTGRTKFHRPVPWQQKRPIRPVCMPLSAQTELKMNYSSGPWMREFVGDFGWLQPTLLLFSVLKFGVTLHFGKFQRPVVILFAIFVVQVSANLFVVTCCECWSSASAEKCPFRHPCRVQRLQNRSFVFLRCLL